MFDGLWISIAWAFIAHMLRVGFFGAVIVIMAILVGPVIWSSYTLKARYFAARAKQRELRPKIDRLMNEDPRMLDEAIAQDADT